MTTLMPHLKEMLIQLKTTQPLFLEAASLNAWSEQEVRYHLLRSVEDEAKTFIISIDKQIEGSSLAIFAIIEQHFVDPYNDLPQRIRQARHGLEISQLYARPLPIKKSKLEHLQQLKSVIPQVFHQYYDDLHH